MIDLRPKEHIITCMNDLRPKKHIITCMNDLRPKKHIITYMNNLRPKKPILTCMNDLRPKKPIMTYMNNLRPVAITSVTMMSCERIMLRYIRPLVDDYLDPLQFVHHAKRNTEDAVLYYLENL